MAPAGEIGNAAGETPALEPGGFQFMLVGLNRAMREGTSHKLTHILSHGDPETIGVPIPGIAARDPKHGCEAMRGPGLSQTCVRSHLATTPIRPLSLLRRHPISAALIERR